MATEDQRGAAELSSALEKNEEAAREVQKAADDLAVVHAVLETTGSKLKEATADTERAIAETANVEKRLAESVRKIDEVNDTLHKEMAKRGESAAS